MHINRSHVARGNHVASTSRNRRNAPGRPSALSTERASLWRSDWVWALQHLQLPTRPPFPGPTALRIGGTLLVNRPGVECHRRVASSVNGPPSLRPSVSGSGMYPQVQTVPLLPPAVVQRSNRIFARLARHWPERTSATGCAACAHRYRQLLPMRGERRGNISWNGGPCRIWIVRGMVRTETGVSIMFVRASANSHEHKETGAPQCNRLTLER
jgi:hypothetical protein